MTARISCIKQELKDPTSIAWAPGKYVVMKTFSITCSFLNPICLRDSQCLNVNHDPGTYLFHIEMIVHIKLVCLPI